MYALTNGWVAPPGPLTFEINGKKWRPKLWQLWLAVSFFLLCVALPNILHFSARDPDDYMRLLQVRDWLAGQDWFDVRQYRMDPPAGADMHWSRLVDLPIAGCMLLFRLFLPDRAAEIAAMSAVPLLQLLCVMLLLQRLMHVLKAPEGASLIAIAIVPLFPLLTSNFLPLRIDHHGWQAVCALACALLVAQGGWRSAFIAGLTAAVWLSISLEGLPMAALVGAIFALRYCRRNVREHEAYLVALAIGGPVLFFATRRADLLAIPYCDMLSWPHFAAFGSAATLAVSARFYPAQDLAVGRFASLMPLALVASACILVPLGACAVDPFVGLDPVLKHYWLDNVLEGLSIAYQLPSVAAMLVWTMFIVVFGVIIAFGQIDQAKARESWGMLALLALGGGLMSLLVMRAGLIAQVLTVPFAALLLARYLPQVRSLRATLPRIVATVACIGLATPTLASAVLKPLDHDARGGIGGAAPGAAEACDWQRLAALPASRLFAPLDPGPEILARTRHSVVMSGYHRNQRKMREVFDVFAGPVARARAIVLANHADYLVVCADPGHLDVYAGAGKDNLSDRLLAGSPPEWLQPVPGYEVGALRVYKVR